MEPLNKREAFAKTLRKETKKKRLSDLRDKLYGLKKKFDFSSLFDFNSIGYVLQKYPDTW